MGAARFGRAWPRRQHRLIVPNDDGAQGGVGSPSTWTPGDKPPSDAAERNVAKDSVPKKPGKRQANAAFGSRERWRADGNTRADRRPFVRHGPGAVGLHAL